MSEVVSNSGIKLDSIMELEPGKTYDVVGTAEVPFRAIQFSVVQGGKGLVINQIRVGTSFILGDAEHQELELPCEDFIRARSVAWGAIPAGTQVAIKVTNKSDKPARFVAYVAGPVVK